MEQIFPKKKKKTHESYSTAIGTKTELLFPFSFGFKRQFQVANTTSLCI